MNLKSESRSPKSEARSELPCWTLALAALGLASLPADAAKSDWTFKADATLKEGYDSNVFLQDTAPNPAIVGAAQPFQDSFITSFTPKVGVAFQPCTHFNMSVSYAPEFAFYHQESGENYVANRGSLLFNGVVGKVTWQMQNSVTYTDGSHEGLTFGGPGGAPAIGGIPIRDRRDALVYRNSFGAFHKHGDWFFRPAVSSYIHDFRTVLKNPLTDPFYQNYVDRNDFNFGVDAGYQVVKDGYLFLGYRYGWQHENQLPPGPSYDYSNQYQRLLVGFEGKLTSWLKFNLFIGPDWRDFDSNTPPGFDTTPLKLYMDGQLVATLGTNDTLTVTLRQFEQPAFGTPSAYEDITYEGTWRHRFGNRFSASLGFKAYGGVWEPPVQRDDWIFTPSVSLAYTHDKHLSAEVSYSHDWADSLVPDKAGREYTRDLVWLAVKYAF